MGSNRWRDSPYPDYRRDVDRSIDFSGLSVDFFLGGKAQHLQQLVSQRLAKPDLVGLDIGCGVGAMHPYLRRTFTRVYGVDVSADAIREAAQRNPWADYAAYDGSTLPFEAASMDVVFASCVLHHVSPASWSHFMHEAKRVLRPRGVFVVFEHNPYNPLTRLAVWRCKFDEDAVLLTRRSTEALFKGAGFGDVVGHYIFFLPIAASWARRAEAWLHALPLGAQYYVAGIRT